jgi:hypothetical protein
MAGFKPSSTAITVNGGVTVTATQVMHRTADNGNNDNVIDTGDDGTMDVGETQGELVLEQPKY